MLRGVSSREKGGWLGGGAVGVDEVGVPRLSAAITTPPLNLMATTEVPVTIGDCVWTFGCEAATKEWS